MTIPTFPSEALFPANAESMPTFPTPAAELHGGSLLLETDWYLLLENGDHILLEA